MFLRTEIVQNVLQNTSVFRSKCQRKSPDRDEHQFYYNLKNVLGKIQWNTNLPSICIQGRRRPKKGSNRIPIVSLSRSRSKVQNTTCYHSALPATVSKKARKLTKVIALCYELLQQNIITILISLSLPIGRYRPTAHNLD